MRPLVVWGTMSLHSGDSADSVLETKTLSLFSHSADDLVAGVADVEEPAPVKGSYSLVALERRELKELGEGEECRDSNQNYLPT